MKSKPYLLFLVLLLTLLTSCVQDRWLEVSPGTYTRLREGDAPAASLQNLTIDREANTLKLAFDERSSTALPFFARPRDQWPSACPTNLFHHYLEVLELEADTVTIGDRVLHNPILVRNCPEEPEQVVLREDGQIGGGGDATTEPYLIFTRTDQRQDSQSKTLPHSLKGYELYSWPTGRDDWKYTLITGTNRQKSAEELIAGADMLKEDGFVKQTVTGTEALLEQLSRLPAGEQIIWHGAMAAPDGAEPSQFRLPEEHIIDTVEARCRELNLELIMTANESE